MNVELKIVRRHRAVAPGSAENVEQSKGHGDDISSRSIFRQPQAQSALSAG